jgi:membrane-bound serine protease (ClpP class)
LLVLALFSLSVLPVNLAGAALVLLGIGLLVAELFVPGIGVLAVGGGIALVIGGIFLFEGSLGVTPWVLVPAAAVLVVAAIVAGRVGLRARRLPVVSGSESYLGRTLTIRSARGNRGWAHFEGAWWTVESRGAPLHVGTAARVVGVDGLNLVVEPEESSS